MKPAWTLLCILGAVNLTFRSMAVPESAERQITFKGVGGTTITGTLLLPADATGPVPALVLLAGSGPTDRDGNQPPAIIADLHKQIASGLATRGVATFRFDKRGMYANRAQIPKEPADYGDFFCWENFVGDSAAAYRFLIAQPGIDPSRTGILGHSEGGMLAVQAADALGDERHPPKVLVLLGTPGRTVDVLITEQLVGLLKRQGATAGQTEFFLAANRRIWDAIRDTGKIPADVPAGLAALYPAYLGRFLHEEMAVEPARLAAKFGGPVLVMNGVEDIQVSAERDAKALDTALQSRPKDDHALFLIAHASHNLKIVKGPDDPGVAGPVAAEAMDGIERWVSEKLTGSGAVKR